jgi:hypothetical protein
LAVVQINVIGTYDGQLCMNTFHYYAVGAGTAPTVTVAQALSKWDSQVWHVEPGVSDDGLWNMYWNGVTDFTFTGQIVAGTGSRSLLENFDPDPRTGGASDGTGALPSGTSVVLKRIGNLAGHKNRGRIYTFAVPNSFEALSKTTSDALDHFSLARAGLESDLVFGTGGNTLTLRPCLITGLAQPTTAQTGLVYSMTEIIRYQRRREVGRGQ